MTGFLLFAIFLLTALAAWLLMGPGQREDPVENRLRELARRNQIRVPEVELAAAASESAEVTAKEREALAKPGRKRVRVQFQAALQGAEGRLQGRLRERILRAGLQIRPGEFLLIQGLGTAVGFLAALVVLGAALSWLGALAGWWLPSLWMRQQEQKRLRALEQQIPDALAMIANSLRSGYSLLQALEVVSRELQGPIGAEFSQALRENQVGLSLDEALTRLSKRAGSRDLDLVITAVLIQRRVGGNLAEIIDRIGHTVRGRIQLLGQVRTLTTQGRLSGWIVGLLPVAVGLALYAMSPEYIEPFLRHPLGWMMLGIAAAMEFTGVMIIRRLVRLEV